MVNPDSRVRHREAEEDGVRDDDRGRLLARHRLRTVLTCYGPLNLIRVLPQIAILTILTVFSSLLTGHPGRAEGRDRRLVVELRATTARSAVAADTSSASVSSPTTRFAGCKRGAARRSER